MLTACFIYHTDNRLRWKSNMWRLQGSRALLRVWRIQRCRRTYTSSSAAPPLPQLFTHNHSRARFIPRLLITMDVFKGIILKTTYSKSGIIPKCLAVKTNAQSDETCLRQTANTAAPSKLPEKPWTHRQSCEKVEIAVTATPWVMSEEQHAHSLWTYDSHSVGQQSGSASFVTLRMTKAWLSLLPDECRFTGTTDKSMWGDFPTGVLRTTSLSQP